MEFLSYEEEIRQLIYPLFQDYGYPFVGANQLQLDNFELEARIKGVPKEAIEELKRFYVILNGIDPSLDSLSIHKPEDSIIYEFWDEKGQLWIGQRDMDMLSWKEGRFHLGHAGDLNYGEDYIFDTMLELLKKGFKDWYPSTDGKYPT